MDDRATAILEAAIVAAREHGITGLTKPRIAEIAGCSPALIAHYWGPLPMLHDAVVEQAIIREELGILARAIVEGHAIALAANETLKERAALSIVGR